MFKLPPLPYAYDALQPTVSADTMHEHHDRHHAKYVDTLNKLLSESGAPRTTLEEVVRKAAGDPAKAKLFNNAAQAWNHSFFWTCMTPDAGAPRGALAARIDRDFGGSAGLRTKFVEEGVSHFGSGWVWLATRGDTLEVLSTHDGENLLTRPELKPLLVCDLWEHAYYLDHQSDRKGFLEAWFDRLANWTFAAEQLNAAANGERLWSSSMSAAA